MSDIGFKVVSLAREWLGKEFNPGKNEQCCYFVRKVFLQAGKELGVTKNPSDNFFPTDAGYANSLAGDDIGYRINKISDLFEGDIIFFKNTYGNWPEGTITHVGIYCGNGEFIHRTTDSQPVAQVSLATYCDGLKFVEGRRVF
ncbi:MAG: NlpC/P60 family protein [bacterium ADurb.Bin363]|nr:MAG: NlpC/P60 family protein [bacterium ADurb.Bin363]